MHLSCKNLLSALILVPNLLFTPFLSAAPMSIVCHEFAPFSFIDKQGETTGVLVEMARIACNQWPEGCDIKLLPNRRAKQVFHSGAANGHFLGWNPQRAEQMWFSIPLLDTEYGFYSLPTSPIHALNQTAGKEVGVFMPSNTYYSLKTIDNELQDQGLPPMKIRPFTAGNLQPIKMLIKQRFDAYFVNKAVGAYYAKQLGYSDLHYISSHKTVQYFLAFKKDHNAKQTVLEFNRLLLNLMEQGAFNELFKQWQVSPATIDPKQFDRLSIPIK